MSWKNYRRTGLSEMRPYVVGEDLTGISVGETDIPEEGGMIARNPKNHADQWYVAKKYFHENLEEVSEVEEKIILPSSLQLGQPAFINLWEEDIIGEACGVHFYPGKVKYDFKVLAANGQETRIYNIDSLFVNSKKKE